MAPKKDKKPETPEPVFVVPAPPKPSPWELAQEKAKNPMMTLAGNPLAEDPSVGLTERIVSYNMDRLHRDARMRRGPNGFVYAGIMANRYGG